MKARQAKELASLGFQGDQKEEAASIDTLVKAIAGVTTSGSAAEHARPSKGQKFREKRAQQAAEREQRIQEEKSNLVDPRVVEDQQLNKKLAPLGFGLKEIKPDGHCLYRAVEDQLALHPDTCPILSYQQLRELAASYMRSHVEDFLPFIGGDLEREIEGKDPQSKFETYCRCRA
jgi:OTU domain-containing protein 6